MMPFAPTWDDVREVIPRPSGLLAGGGRSPGRIVECPAISLEDFAKVVKVAGLNAR